jgi:hypothetical protein
MTFANAILTLHITLGVTGLLLGTIALWTRKRHGRHTTVGEAYHWIMLSVCVTATVVAILDWQRLWWFVLVAGGSYAFALRGYMAAKRRWPGWLRAHITGQGGSYITMVTAALVVNWQRLTGEPGVTSPWAWLLPTLIGTPIIAWVQRQVALGKRPKP